MNVIRQLQQLAESTPNHILFEQEAQSVSAIEVLVQAKAMAQRIREVTAVPTANIAILLPRGISAAIAIYAVLIADACYVPLDTRSPDDRVSFVVKDAECSCLIGQGDAPHWLKSVGIAYLDIDAVGEIETEFPRRLHDHPEQLAAILYTSGSTGRPKGIAISHRALVGFVQWGRETFSIDSDDRIANLAPFHFDLSLFDLFTGPGIAATTVFIPDRLKLAPAKLVDWLIEQRITTWYTVPSILGFLVLKGGLENKVVPQLRQVLFAGEVFPSTKLKQLVDWLPGTRFYNLFGPTETNVCLCWSVDSSWGSADQSIPVGSAACDAELSIDGETGELLMKGPCLMSGYWSQGKLKLPLDKQGWFHTGDLVSLNSAKQYEYHGRLDRMIKSAGYRVEPAEIEAVLNEVAGVRSVAVLGLPDPVSGTRIVAAVAGVGLSQAELRKHMSEKLPAYMRPGFYKIQEKLPELTNGKLDYQAVVELFGKKNI